MNGTLSGKTTLPFSILHPFSNGVNSKWREFAPVEQILFIKSGFHLKRAMLSKAVTRESPKMSPFVKTAANIEM